MNKKDRFKLIFGVFISVLLVYVLLKFVNLNEIWLMLQKISLSWVFAGFFVFFIMLFLRAKRFSVLLEKKIKTKVLFPIVCVHGFANSIFPLRSGELAYIYLVKKRGIKLGEGLSTLIIARAGDFFSVLLFFILSVIVSGRLFNLIYLLWVGFILLTALILSFFFLVIYGERTISYIKNKSKNKTLLKMTMKLGGVVKNFNILKSKGILLKVAAFSILINIMQYLLYYTMLEALNIKITLGALIIGISLYSFLFYLPIQGIAGIGTYEGYWSAAFIAVNVPRSVAISSGFGQHIINLFYSAIFGLFGFFRIKKK